MTDSQLRQALLGKLGTSKQAMYQQAERIKKKYGPMSTEDAIYWLAVDKGIDVSRFLDKEDFDRIRQMRSSQAPQVTASGGQSSKAPAPAAPTRDSTPTPAATFNMRSFHPLVIRSSRKLFVDGHHTEAVYRAFVRVNNRVKKLTGISDDGEGLMSKAFGGTSPALQMTGLANRSEIDEQKGTCFLMMGAMTGMRNPRVHEDRWEPDNDVNAVLDALSFASLLHRFLDRCEASRAT